MAQNDNELPQVVGRLEDLPKVTNGVETSCPGCGLKVKIGYGGEGEHLMMAFHAVPSCLDFDKRDVLHYVQWVREHYEKLERGC